jgi:hypothetical protein
MEAVLGAAPSKPRRRLCSWENVASCCPQGNRQLGEFPAGPGRAALWAGYMQRRLDRTCVHRPVLLQVIARATDSSLEAFSQQAASRESSGWCCEVWRLDRWNAADCCSRYTEDSLVCIVLFVGDKRLCLCRGAESHFVVC